MQCKNGKHSLVAIFAVGPEMEQQVVRWCGNCGGVVVDTDVDSRTAPGDVMKMRFPLITKNQKQSFRRDFTKGYICAVANIINTHGNTQIAKDVLGANVPDDWSVIDELDVTTLRHAGVIK